VYSVGGLATSLGMSQQHPQTATAEHITFFPVFEPGTIFDQVQTDYQVAAGVRFIFTWIRIVMLAICNCPYAI
jgi:hypothetical protein